MPQLRSRIVSWRPATVISDRKSGGRSGARARPDFLEAREDPVLARTGKSLMNGIVRLALTLALIVPLGAASLNAQPTFGPSKPGGGADTGKPAPGKVFRPSGSETAPPAAPPTSPPAAPAAAPALDWGNSQVDVAYAEPQDPQFRPIRDRLMRRQVLEQLRVFLSPLRLPRKLLVQTDQCNAERRPYQPGGPVTICYEYVAKVDQVAPRNPPADGLPRRHQRPRRGRRLGHARAPAPARRDRRALRARAAVRPPALLASHHALHAAGRRARPRRGRCSTRSAAGISRP